MNTPITLAAFAAALPPLPLSTLQIKAAELRNSISHLLSSNTELQPYADAGDEECREAITENREVIGRMEARLEVLRREVERRGVRWEDWDEGREEREVKMSSGDTGEVVNGHEERERETGGAAHGEGIQQQQESRGLSDSELSLALRQRLSESGMDL